MKRFRVFAGPNGSGKSTIIRSVQDHIINDKHIDFGIYINADDIAVLLNKDHFHFNNFGMPDANTGSLRDFAIRSGLLRGAFTLDVFDSAFTLQNGHIVLSNKEHKEMFAQVLSNYLVYALLQAGKKCTMETVFSHPSKVVMMRQAKEMGYKVYLYFVATEDPEINKARVKIRVLKGGHSVPEPAIEDRYYKSLGLLYDATCTADHCYLFDNSGGENENKLVASCKVQNGEKVWNKCAALPGWFTEHYEKKAQLRQN